MSRCQRCVEDKLRRMVRERDVQIKRLQDQVRQLLQERTARRVREITDADYRPLPAEGE